eukprot:TRINITY_DN4610_c0_g1_i1.p1 TRINITY_DN4610_c0_g1~~TRINITY_DN4610_c0_g1_i1.p1  ORF type:complete len:623 (-),score=232.30 TRINITY_DN4610_c0_g1_i1:78-1946(-)
MVKCKILLILLLFSLKLILCETLDYDSLAPILSESLNLNEDNSFSIDSIFDDYSQSSNYFDEFYPIGMEIDTTLIYDNLYSIDIDGSIETNVNSDDGTINFTFDIDIDVTPLENSIYSSSEIDSSEETTAVDPFAPIDSYLFDTTSVTEESDYADYTQEEAQEQQQEEEEDDDAIDYSSTDILTPLPNYPKLIADVVNTLWNVIYVHNNRSTSLDVDSIIDPYPELPGIGTSPIDVDSSELPVNDDESSLPDSTESNIDDTIEPENDQETSNNSSGQDTDIDGSNTEEISGDSDETIPDTTESDGSNSQNVEPEESGTESNTDPVDSSIVEPSEPSSTEEPSTEEDVIEESDSTPEESVSTPKLDSESEPTPEVESEIEPEVDPAVEPEDENDPSDPYIETTDSIDSDGSTADEPSDDSSSSNNEELNTPTFIINSVEPSQIQFASTGIEYVNIRCDNIHQRIPVVNNTTIINGLENGVVCQITTDSDVQITESVVIPFEIPVSPTVELRFLQNVPVSLIISWDPIPQSELYKLIITGDMEKTIETVDNSASMDLPVNMDGKEIKITLSCKNEVSTWSDESKATVVTLSHEYIQPDNHSGIEKSTILAFNLIVGLLILFFTI